MIETEKAETFKAIANEILENVEAGVMNIKAGVSVDLNCDEITIALYTLKCISEDFGATLIKQQTQKLEDLFLGFNAESSNEIRSIDLFINDVLEIRKLIDEIGHNSKTNHECKGLIYLVDDEPEILVQLEELIKPCGFTVKTFHNGKEAIKNIKNDKPDVIVSDIKMPEMDGIEFLKQFVINGIDIPIIFVSGHGNKEIMLDCINHGAHAFIEKPFSEAVVITTCINAFKEKQARKLLSKSINSVIYQFGDLDEVLKLYGKENIRLSLETDLKIIREQKEKLKRSRSR